MCVQDAYTARPIPISGGPVHGRECMYADICKYCGRNGRCPGSGVSVEKEKRRRGRRHWKRSCTTGGAREERLSKTAWPREWQRVTRGSFISWPQIWRPDRRQKLFFSLVEFGEAERTLIARTTSRAFLDTVLANERHILCAVRRGVKRRTETRAEKMERAANVSEMRCSGGRRIVYTRADRSRNCRLRNEKEM